ncbi:MAG TPA: hypothetical protein VHQ90_09650 [Thermoanaerobaculia bacterium]|nr:hypothetical protein [Thermoanaerobaculia bacterium]
MTRSSVGALALVGFFGARVFSAQITGGQAPGTQDVEVKSPLLVQVSLAPKPGHPSLLELPFESTLTFRGTRQYVCDKARVEHVTIFKHRTSSASFGHYPTPRDKVRLVIGARLSTAWFAQRIDLTLGLYDGEKKIKSESWNGLRIGRDSTMGVMGGSNSKTEELKIELSDQDLAALLAEGHELKVKVLVAINDN